MGSHGLNLESLAGLESPARSHGPESGDSGATAAAVRPAEEL